jgi:hypothetical protein
LAREAGKEKSLVSGGPPTAKKAEKGLIHFVSLPMLHRRILCWPAARSIFDSLAQNRFDLRHEVIGTGELAKPNRV